MFTMALNLTALATAENFYVPMPAGLTARLVKADTSLYTVLTAANAVITFSDGTTNIGTVTITQSGCAEGDIDHLVLDTSSGGAVELGGSTYLKVALDGGPSAGAAILVMTFDEYHSAI